MYFYKHKTRETKISSKHPFFLVAQQLNTYFCVFVSCLFSVGLGKG